MDLPVTVCYNTYGLNKAQIVYKVNKLFEVIISLKQVGKSQPKNKGHNK